MAGSVKEIIQQLDQIHFTFEGITKCEFLNCQAGGTVNFNMTLKAVNGKGERVASGVYIEVLNSENPRNQILKTSKIICLK